jgi:hypothetical protein
MIRVYFRGGLGNQMFQYAALKSLAVRNGYELRIPECQLVRVFDLKEKVLDRKLLKAQAKYNETGGFAFNRGFFELKDGTDLRGSYQTEKYFIDIKGLIVDTFRKKWKTPKNNAVSIHVRRGDYLKKPSYHPVCTSEYYRKAMALFPSAEFHVFSDDIRWCREAFKGSQFKFFEGNKDYVDLELMASCSHHIVANSSFSWWAAYLGQNPDKKIVAPKIWFGKSFGGNLSDLRPSSWIQI